MKRTLIALAIAGFVGASLTAVATPTAARAGGLENCADYEFVAVRGSGETSSDHDGAGRTLKSAYTALHAQLDHMGYTSALDVVDYQAVALGPIEQLEGATNTTGPYTASVGDGVENLTQAIGDVQEQCSDSKIILGGYSQGAQVIDETLDMKTHGVYDTITAESYVLWETAHYTPVSSSTANSIAGVLLFGDPKFNGSDTTVNDSTDDPDHHGVWLLHPKWGTKLDNASTKVVSSCHLADVVCNSRRDVTVLGIHHTVADAAWVYDTQDAEGDDPAGNALGLPHTNYWVDANRSVNDLLSTMGLPVVSSRTLGVDDDRPTDTAYLVDSRADMWRIDPTNDSDQGTWGNDGVSYMDEVANAINNQIRRQADRQADERWMLAMYYAATEPLGDQYKQPFTGYYPYPEYNTMARQDLNDYVPSQIRTLEEQAGGPAASGLDGYSLDSSDYSIPTTLNRQLLETANIFAAADAKTNSYVWPRLGYPTGAIPGHQRRIVIITDRPNDLAASMPVVTPGDQPKRETWSLASTVSYLVQLGVSVSFWNPIADPSGGAATSSYKANAHSGSATQANLHLAEAVQTIDLHDSDASPSSTDIAAATHGTAVDSAGGLEDINAYAAQQPVAQINAPVSSYTGQPLTATSANTSGDGLDTLAHTDWSVIGPDGSTVDTETTDGGGPLQYTPPTAGQYTVRSTITLRSGFSGSASRTVKVSDAPTEVPTSPIVSAGVDDNNNVTLTWPAPAQATYYTVYDSNGNILDRVNPLTDTNGNLTWHQSLPDQSGDISYTVSASNDVGEGAQSASATTTLHELPPDAPTVTGTVDASNNVTLTWPAEDRATSFTVYDANHQVLDNFDADGDADLSWTQSLSEQAGNVTYFVSASDAGGEGPLSSAVKITLHNLHPIPANVPDASGFPAYSGAVDTQGVPIDTATTTTAALQNECSSESPTAESGAANATFSEGYGTVNGPFSTESVTAVGTNSIVVDFTATNQQFCDLYDNGGLPSSEFQNLPLSVDPMYGTALYDTTAAWSVPFSAYMSVGPASDGLTSSRSFSVLLNFDSTFNASDQAAELQSEIDDGGTSWQVWLGISQNVGWIFRGPADTGGGGNTAT